MGTKQSFVHSCAWQNILCICIHKSMHRNAGTPNWKCVCIHFHCGVQHRNAFIWVQKVPRTTRQIDMKSRKTRGRPDVRTDGRIYGRTDGGTYGWMDRHIILPLRRFEPVACGWIHCAQLRAVGMNFYCWFKAVCSNKHSHIIYILKRLFYFMLVY